MLLSCFYFLSFVSTPVFGQLECKPIDDCDNLRLLLVREYPDSACQAVGSGSCGNADPFHEVVYRVFLHFETDSSVSDSELYFMLDYSWLNATVNLINTGGEGYSYINKEATKECLKTGSGQWDTDNLVIFEISDNNEVAIQLENETSSPCGASGAQIQFTPDAPAGVSNCSVTSNCAYAELFPIVVQAYPGETLRLECKVLQYAPSGEIDGCDTSSCSLNSGTGNVNTNGISNYTVPSAASPTGENGTLEISFGDTLYNVDGTYDIEVVLNRKDGTGNLEIEYLEFMVEVNAEIAVSDPSFPSSNGPAAVRKTAGAGNAVIYQLYYVMSFDTAITMAPDDDTVLDIIRIGPPMPFNQEFEMVFKLVNEDDSRVRTDEGCSKVKLSADTVLFFNDSGNPVCTNLELDHKVFRVEGREDTSGTCPAPFVRFGLVSTGMPDEIEFDYFECQLLIHATGQLNISEVVFPSNWTCENQLTGCDTTCWDLEQGPDKVVHVRMCRDSSIIQFPTDSAFMEIHFTGFGCIDGVDVQLLRFNRDEDSSITCVPIINLENQGFPACSPEIKGT
ncbi:MAG: hypothetical protein IT270_21250, partial [Saprospiraceae bacterium]|nr:hypothetical protein [Saprospiraceae bacterium]